MPRRDNLKAKRLRFGFDKGKTTIQRDRTAIIIPKRNKQTTSFDFFTYDVKTGYGNRMFRIRKK